MIHHNFSTVVDLKSIGIILGAIILVVVIFYIFKNLEWKYKNREFQIAERAVKIINSKLKIKEKIKEAEEYIKYYNALRTNKSKLNLRYWKDLFLDRKHPDKTYLINMEMANGFHRTFIKKIINNEFKYQRKVYIVDPDLKYYNLDSKLYQLDYHENLTIPVKRGIPVDQIKKSIKAAGLIPSQSTNPSLIEKYLQSKLLESLMKGGQFIESLKKFSFYLIIIMTIVAIHLLLFVHGSGMLASMKIPGF